ncbi:MAG: hypothetical protein HS119_10955 [Flavobacteriales bacterium]|nr:hypothetical protein [Flavobacteriales bacterium]
MINNFKIYVFFALSFLVVDVFAQDKLLFLNGKELNGQLLNTNNFETSFKTANGKEYLIENFRVFSYTQNGQESLLYKYDTLEGNFLSEKDMRLFVFGERDAHQTYHSKFSNALGFLVGGAAGYVMHKDQAFIYVAAPLVYTSVTLFFPTSVKQKRLTDLQYLKEDEYLRGHERIARSKRTQNALKSSVLGMGAGFLISFLVNGSSN